MDQRNQKITLMSFVGVGALVYFITRILVDSMASILPVVARLKTQAIFEHGVPLGLGFVAFLLLQTRKDIRKWADLVLTEFFKVVWPSAKDTRAMTVVVCIMLIISGISLMAFDNLSSSVVKLVLGM